MFLRESRHKRASSEIVTYLQLAENVWNRDTQERLCEDTWRNIRDDLRQVKLAQLLTPNGLVWQVTEPGPAAAKRLKQMGIPQPKPVLKVESAPGDTPVSA